MNKILYEALVDRDKTYLGQQYVAVKTTGIYYNLDCPAKNPLYKNTVFYSDFTQCLIRGYRECKKCYPLRALADLKEVTLSTPIRDYLKWLEGEVCPPKSYRQHPIDSVETLRLIQNAFEKLTGFSLGRYVRLKRAGAILNHDKKDQTHCNPLAFSFIDTPLGEMVTCHSAKGLMLLEFTDRKSLETELVKLKKTLKGYFVFKETEQHHALSKQIDEYFKGERTQFTHQLDLIGTEFQKQAWLALLDIPYGDQVSYSDQAKRLNAPNAVRAVANANGKNMMAIIIPCHRVLGSDGNLTGYGGGIERKRQLLEIEAGNKTNKSSRLL